MIKKLVQKTQKYKQKYYRLKKLINKKDNPPTPNTRVQTLLEDDKQKATIVKKLLFGEVISDQLKENYKNLTNFKEKQIFKKAITGTIIKKYRVTNKVQKICRGGKVFFKSTEASNISDYSRKRSYLKRQAQKRNAIWRFLESDLHSKMCPGKRDYCTKKKVTKQKRYLNDTLRNLHKKFLATHPNIPISYAFWCKNRPFWIVHRKVSARDTCGCTPCSNMTLIVQALFRVSVVEKNNTSDIINLFCCENKTEKCLLRECKKCKTKKVTYKNHDSTANAYYFKWVVKKDTFPGRWIRIRGQMMEWPPRPPDLTPLGFFV